jgi:hypothetical protein
LKPHNAFGKSFIHEDQTLGDKNLMKLRAMALAWLLTALPQAACAQGQDGAFWLRACSAALKIDEGALAPAEDQYAALGCTGSVSGFLDGMTLASTGTKTQRAVCLPDRGISNDQATRVFVKYLRDNPEILHQSGRMSFYIALAKSFPCRK